MEVIRHQAPSRNPPGDTITRLAHQRYEYPIVSRVMEYPGAAVAFLRSVLTFSPGFLKAPLVFSIHRSRPC